MSELKPCPFCGSKANLSRTVPNMVLCSNENCWFYNNFVGILTWNTRPIEDKLQAEISNLRGASSADNKRMLEAGQRVNLVMGCDTPEVMADEILSLRAEIARLKAELKYTDDLLKEATETIGSVIACCTYDSNNDAKIGIYGIDEKAFTKIDQFMTHYNDAVSAGKVSVDVKRDLSDAEIEELGAQEAERKTFCPNCEVTNE